MRNVRKLLGVLPICCGMLAFSTSAAASGSAAGSQARLAVRIAPCDSAWNGATPYVSGNKVSYRGINYTAAYWTQGNYPASSSGSADSAQPWVAGPACRVAKVAAAASDHDANFSPATLQFLKTNTGLDGEQWDNIMKLVNKPEQDSLDWTKFYGYCEPLGDRRGYTIGIFGATTGGPNDTGPDGPALFKEYDAASGASSPSIAGGLTRAGVHGSMQGSILNITDSKTVFCGKIGGLQNNAAWREAMWHTFYNVYIKYSLQQARQRGFSSALTIGSFVDTALNQGADGDSGSLEGVLAKSGSSTNEKTFMTSFYAQRTKVVDTNEYNQPPNGKNRVKQWSSLLGMGETDLKDADAAVAKVTNWTLK
ncbi:chitosanase domain protein [Collimonas fungivorans]|uniref:Chitosanase domain protein n=1 Tax=Collimonas fungivorans TaxID=158899 RepID=A0A127PBR6_9BURK|nr:chitosanase [Collimonas fungivorans]AMO95218.1 chitosanase domain protein [Collimonas fungivorans]